MPNDTAPSTTAATYVDANAFHVVPERIFLVESIFADRAGPASEPEPLDEDFGVVFSIGLHRLSRLRLTVALSVATVGDDTPFDLRVTYAGQFLMHDRVPSEEVERLWEYVAGDLAVKVLYPYLRQAVSDLTEKSRGDKLYLPFIPIPLELPEGEELTVPLPPDGTQVSLFDDLEAG